jgi:UDP-glucose 4-epimerase
MRILISGACGYIGSVLLIYLLKNNIDFAGIDNLSNSKKKFFPKQKKLYIGDISNKKLLKKIYQEFLPDTIIHLAASISVEESEKNKKFYNENNFVKSKIFYNFFKLKIKNFFFASTAAIYSNKPNIKKESLIEKPSNYYGLTKKKFEDYLIKNCSKNNNLNIKIFRFFNVVGSHVNKNVGNISKKSSHLLNKLCESFFYYKIFIINGNKYKTIDGTAIRDFIDVNDICKIIIFFLKNLQIKRTIFNLATEKNYSVLEICNYFKKLVKTKIKIKIGTNRKGDLYRLICSNKNLRKFYKSRFINLKKSMKNHLDFFKKYPRRLEI